MISIVMPAYNAQKYIKTAILSVENQTCSDDWELIVVDDCSKDNTAKIIKRMAQSDPRIHYVRNASNLGVAESRNHGVALAQGEWVAFLDSDDSWHKDKLKIQMNCAKRNHADFLFCASALMDKHDNLIKTWWPVPERITYKELLKQNVIACSSVLIRRELIQEYPMCHGEHMHEDFAVWLQILRNKKITAYGINKPLLIYRIHPGSKSANKIKAARMTYRVYRHIGLPPHKRLYYWLCYLHRSIVKYSRVTPYQA